MLVEFSKMKRELTEVCRKVMHLGSFAVYQERLITDTREFITLHLLPFFDIMQRVNIEAEQENMDGRLSEIKSASPPLSPKTNEQL